jgi:fumarate reductase flavoprotein subunit
MGSRENAISENVQDVLVIGAGIAGLIAAIEANRSGGQVTILEKMKKFSDAPAGYMGVKGNDTTKGGGAFGGFFPFPLPESTTVEDVVRIGMEESKGRAFPSVCKFVWSRLNEDMEWFKTLGCPTEKYEVLLGPGGFRTKGRGAVICPSLLRTAQKEGVKAFFNHNALELLSNKNRRTIGVRVLTEEGVKDFKGKAVVLATGGFQGNQKMKDEYIGPPLSDIVLTGSSLNTGDGHQMALKIGAKLVNMESTHTRWHHKKGSHTNPHRMIGYWGIYINGEGKRFIDETGGSTETSMVCGYQPGGKCALFFDQKIKEMREAAIEMHLKAKGDLIKANSVEELARMINYPEETVRKTIEEFNSHVNSDHKALNADPPKGKERATAYKIENPPFYVIYPVFPALNHTTGGPLINEKAQVLDTEERPIEGLYGAGSLAFGFMDGLYHIAEAVSGLELSTTLGRMAGRNAAVYALSPS